LRGGGLDFAVDGRRLDDRYELRTIGNVVLFGKFNEFLVVGDHRLVGIGGNGVDEAGIQINEIFDTFKGQNFGSVVQTVDRG